MAARSGIKTILKYTGIPPSWLEKRPKLPSRNWLIFLSVTSSVVGLYIYDRRQCKHIRQSYVDKVKHLAEQPADPFEIPRKVTVYAAKWPGDEDYDQSMRYFRKYVKPILVAAAIDYDMVPGKRHGDIAKRIADDIRVSRRFDLGLDPETELTKTLPSYRPPAERRRHELEGGIVIIGRPTFKEFMSGLQKGWSEGLEKVDQDEVLAHILENDAHFDEPEDHFTGDAPHTSQKLSPQSSPVFSPLQMRPSTLPQRSQKDSNNTNQPPSIIPSLAPLLLVPFINHIGIPQVPLMIWGFFNQRHKVRTGAEAGYRIVMKETRPIDVPENIIDLTSSSPTTDDVPPTKYGDLDFDIEAESYYKKSLDSLHQDTEKARKKYYEGLAAKLNTARQLARGTREPTKEELENPPPTEVELRAERLKKERRWREDLEGWDIIKPSSNVSWDERCRGALRIFITPNNEDDSQTS
ncbi:hypothetical protein BYT27DRAFT_7178702 [Phlegmacium glaucopus]|nr:hypothetical protein BYT27DRAFT_7178702 [Phlegmacium glaucopus]